MHFGKEVSLKIYDRKEIAAGQSRYQIARQPKFKARREIFPDRRADFQLLLNGMPLIHVELKKRGIDLREAFNQIERYQRDSFWAGSGLYNFVQIFVISNGTLTKYYSNTTREFHINNQKKKKSNSFEFTSYWADQKNNGITDLIDFAKTFFTKHTLLNVLTKYCVFTSEEDLLVMRPYQIVATEKILNKIEIAPNYINIIAPYLFSLIGSLYYITFYKHFLHHLMIQM